VTRATGWLTLFVTGTGLFVVTPLLPAIARDLAVSRGAAGWTVTVFALAYIVGGPRLGSLADRHGPRTVLAAALGLFAAANVATGLAHDYRVHLVCRAVTGLAASGVTPSVYALVGRSAPPGRRATWLAVITSGLLVALAVGAPAGALLSSAIGWSGVFLCVGGLAALVLLVDLHRSVDARPAPANRETARDVPIGIRLRAVSVTGLWALAVYGLYTYLGVGLAEDAHMSTETIAVALAAYGAGAVAGNLAGGALADRYGGARVTVASLAGLAAMEAVVGFAVFGDHALVVVALGLFALTAYPFFTAHQVRLLTAFPDAGGALLAWNNTALYVGILGGSAIGGHLLAVAGFSALTWYVSTAAAIGAIVSTRVVPRRPGAERRRGAAPSSEVRSVRGIPFRQAS
jgi:predicted MFS family arabinose efflux permease